VRTVVRIAQNATNRVRNPDFLRDLSLSESAELLIWNHEEGTWSRLVRYGALKEAWSVWHDMAMGFECAGTGGGVFGNWVGETMSKVIKLWPLTPTFYLYMILGHVGL
jgi:hypothetical protein